MVTHLIRDLSRRMWLVYVGIVVWLTLMWGVIGSDLDGPIPGPLSLPVALLAVGPFNGRAFAALPVARRHVWRARWLLGTVGTATCSTLARLLASSVQHHDALDRVIEPGALLGTWLVEFIGCGALFGITVLLAVSPLPALVCRWPLKVSMSVGLGVGGLLGAGIAGLFVALFETRDHLALQRDDFTGVVGLAAVLGMALTAIGYRHAPAWPRLSSAEVKAMFASRPAPTRMSPDTRPLGLRQLVWGQALSALGGAAGLMALLLMMTSPPREWVPRLAGAFTDGLAFRYVGGILPWPNPVWLPLFLYSGRNTLLPVLRHLRVLPLSLPRLNLSMLSASVPYWILVIAAFSILQLVVTRTVPRIDVATFMLCIGFSALAQAASLATRPLLAVTGLMQILLCVPIGLALKLALQTPWSVPAQRATLAVTMLVAAALWNHRLLTHQSPKHQPLPMTTSPS